MLAKSKRGFQLQARSSLNVLEKKKKNFDRVIDEWRQKVADGQTALGESQHETRSAQAEYVRSKQQLDESMEQVGSEQNCKTFTAGIQNCWFHVSSCLIQPSFAVGRGETRVQQCVN